MLIELPAGLALLALTGLMLLGNHWTRRFLPPFFVRIAFVAGVALTIAGLVDLMLTGTVEWYAVARNTVVGLLMVGAPALFLLWDRANRTDSVENLEHPLFRSPHKPTVPEPTRTNTNRVTAPAREYEPFPTPPMNTG